MSGQHSDKKHKFKKYIVLYWIIFSVFILGGVSVFIFAFFGGFGNMPSFDILENPQTNLATQILSDNGKILGKIYMSDNRVSVDYEDLPLHLINALVDTEDERFFKHSGIDLEGTIRAFAFLGLKGGGSTISQQLGRQLFVGVRSRNIFSAIIQKIKEWVIALQLERSYTKEEIIAMYFNIYDFNNHADGIRSASHIYFNKEPKNLLIEEASVLVGMFKNSTLYNPIRNSKGVINRRNVVLAQMYRHGHLTKKEKDSISALPLVLDFHPESHDKGVATYFREYVRSFLRKWTSNNLKPDGTKYNLYKDGLKVYTSINLEMQKIAEASLKTHMKNLQKTFFERQNMMDNDYAPFVDINEEQADYIKTLSVKRSERWRHMKYDLKKDENTILTSFNEPKEMKVFSWEGEKDTVMTPMDSIMYYKFYLRSGMASIEPQSGYIKTWVGGIDYKHFKYDQVIQGRRQVGSTFKPFVYAAAIDQLRLSPCYTIPDVLHCIEARKYGNIEPWCPNNSSNTYTGKMVTLKEALAKSINTVTATLMDRVGPRPVVNLVKNLGINSRIPTVPSIALGTPDIKLLEMVSAYSTFANKGIYIEPSFILRIEDKKGKVLFEKDPVVRDVLSDELSYVMLSLMKGVTRYGSGARLRGDYFRENNIYKDSIITGYPYMFKNPIAGKTGTTQNNSDGWFIGIVPNLVTGVWVGGDDRAIHFKSTAYGQGATMALPIWALFMKGCYENSEINISKEDFNRPDNLTILTDCEDEKQYNQKVIDTISNDSIIKLDSPVEKSIDNFDF